MENDENLWEPIIERFKEQYRYLANRMTEWSPYSQSEIIVELDDGSRWLYDYSVNSVILYVDNSKLDDGISESVWRERFSQRLRNRMYKKGVDQEELSKITGISTVSLSKYMNCKATPSTYNVRKIARALDCPTQYLSDF